VDELTACSNARGGTILLGVDGKTRNPNERLDAVESWVREICNNSIKPSLNASIRKLEILDFSGSRVPIIREESLKLLGRLPECSLIDESELRLVIWAAPLPNGVL
jgi:hypothetical protein